jgi:predicted RNase H-like HicB family nuclease
VATRESIGNTELMGSILLTGMVSEESGQYVSFCRELGTASCGDTIEEAFENLWDAVTVHLDALKETGEVLQVLRERNIRVEADGEDPIDEPTVRIPLGKIVELHRQPIGTVRLK